MTHTLTDLESSAVAELLAYGADRPGAWFAVEHVFAGPRFRTQRAAVTRALERSNWPKELLRRYSAGCWLFCAARADERLPGEFPPVHGLCQVLTAPRIGSPGALTINGEAYRLEVLLEGPGCAQVRVGYRLQKLGSGAVREVRWPLAPGQRWRCTCEDRTYRRRPGGLCKHAAAVEALREKGSLP